VSAALAQASAQPAAETERVTVTVQDLRWVRESGKIAAWADVELLIGPVTANVCDLAIRGQRHGTAATTVA
jgi:hypothetical protein